MKQHNSLIEYGNLASAWGSKIVVAKPGAKMSLSPNFRYGSTEFQKEYNAWLRDFFGEEHIVEPGKPLYSEVANTWIMHPEDYARLQNLNRTRTELPRGVRGL